MILLRCYTSRLAINRRLSVKCTPHSHIVRVRGYTGKPQSSPTKYEPEPDYEATAQNIQNSFIGHAVFAFRNLGKVLAYVGYGTIIIGLATATAFEGAHFWVERQMRVPPDEDAERWGWEVEGWTGGDKGGTSSALGLYGRHAVRAAWFALHHSSSLNAASVISHTHGNPGSGNLNLVDTDLESARLYLETAMSRIRNQDGKVPLNRVGLDLLERHAFVLEQIGTRASALRARSEYMQVLEGRTGQRLAQARLAVKLGNISERLGDDESALLWWARGIELTKDDAAAKMSTPAGAMSSPASSNKDNMPIASTEPKDTSTLRKMSTPLPGNGSSAFIEKTSATYAFPIQPPSTPAAQRTLVAAMVSLSAYYSKRRQLQEAKRIEERAISLIDAMVPMPETVSTSREAQSAAQALHHVYLMQRKSVLALHHAEVIHSLSSQTPSILAKASSIMEPVTDLLTAASSSEVVARMLTGSSHLSLGVPSDLSSETATPLDPKVSCPPAANATLAPMYRDSPWLRTSARAVLRDARLTAAEAWDLAGVLYGEVGEGEARAMECFERALGWVGVPASEGDLREGISVQAWQSLWERYGEARARVMKKDQAKGQGE